MNIPKKLELTGDMSEDLLSIGDKFNELIDYLRAKEEASNYKIVSFDPVGETVPEASKEECLCSPKDRYADAKCPIHGVKQDPPEHEESHKEDEVIGRNWYFEGDELVITRGKWVIDRYKKHDRED